MIGASPSFADEVDDMILNEREESGMIGLACPQRSFVAA